MYRVMIIDDETALRNLLRKTINWEEKNLKVVGEAASGIEAINIIDECKPDIAFVDIRMPFMDGIEFSKLAIKRYPRLKILVFTAFDEFHYAKACIGIGVSEYLLKPIVRADIHAVLDKTVADLNQEQCREMELTANVSGYVGMNKIQEYIVRNYEDAELNLTAAANHFGFNPSYLSRKFKEETGVSFIDFLTAVRMKQACRLAGKGKLMYITARLVGIPDPNYFGKCFKKYQGISYSDYVRQVEGEENGGQP